MDSEAWYRLGNERQDQGQHQAAAECYERATALDASHAKAWNNLGVSRQALGQDAPAAEAYRCAIRCDPSLALAHTNLGHLLSESADHGAAARSFEAAAGAGGGTAELWCQAGRSWQRAGDNDRAAEVFRKALAADPAYARTYLGLAGIAASRGDARGAEAWYSAGVEQCPEDAILRHMLAAARGELSARPPEGYVAATFDAMAHGFDRHVLQDLDYKVPQRLAELVRPLLGDAASRVLDLGCGTGLLGATLSRPGLELDGVDVSREMLLQADRRNVYLRLTQRDLLEELQRAPPGTYQGIVAADTFIYLGDLAPVFEAAARALAPGGLFAFSLEHSGTANYRLQASGRYAHSPAYVRALAERCALSEHAFVASPLRREGAQYLEGWLACFLRRRDAGAA